MLNMLINLSPWAFLAVGAYLFFRELGQLNAPTVSAVRDGKPAQEPFFVQSLHTLLMVFAGGSVLWAMRQPPQAPLLDWIANACLWAAVVGAVFLIVDDLFLAPQRQKALGADDRVAPAPLRVEILRRLMLAFLLGAAIRAVRTQALDFSLVLVIAMAVTGLLWAIDAWWLRAKRRALFGAERAQAIPPPVSIEYAQSFFPVIVIVLVVRSFLLEPFRIPSDSMMPGLKDGDFIFVNKYAYGLRLPVLNSKILAIGEPKRGDVIVFRLPSEPSTNYIKRLVGLPGDRIKVESNVVYVNGERMPVELTGFYSDNKRYFNAQLGIETLSGVKHQIMLTQDNYHTDFEAQVPQGHYFFMGDNRNNSQDSRFPAVGFVPDKNLVGHAVRIWMHWNEGPDWGRIGSKIE